MQAVWKCHRCHGVAAAILHLFECVLNVKLVRGECNIGGLVKFPFFERHHAFRKLRRFWQCGISVSYVPGPLFIANARVQMDNAPGLKSQWRRISKNGQNIKKSSFVQNIKS